jgi:hypothetical protein
MKTLREKTGAFAAAIIPGLGDRITQTRFANCEDTNALTCTINTFAERWLSAFYVLFTALAVILLLVSGIQYITALGNDDATKKARARMFNVVLGIVLLISSYAILNVILKGAVAIGGLFK